MISNLIPTYLNNSNSYLVVVTDLDGNYSYVNPLFNKAFEFLKVDFIGQPFQITIHPEDIILCNIAAQDCIDHPGKVNQLQVRKPDYAPGEFNLTSWEFSLLTNHKNEPLGILCIGNDVTEVARVNLQVNKFAAKLDNIIEEITDGYYMLNHDWKFIKINNVAEKIIGIPKAQLLGTKIWDILPDKVSKFNYPIYFKRAMKDAVTLNFEDYRPDLGLWFNIVCYPSHEGLTVFFKDITEEKKILEQLQDSRFKLKAILDSTTDSNILISPKYKVLSFNKHAFDVCKVVFKVSMKEFDDMWDFVLPNDEMDFYRDTQKAFNGAYLKFEKELLIEGTGVWYEVSYFPVYADNNEIIGVTFNIANIDFRKKAELKIQQSEVMLKSLYNSSNEALTFLDKNFRILFSNDQAKVITKNLYHKVSKNGDYVLDFYSPKLRNEFKDFYKRVLNGEIISIERNSHGSWWSFSLYPVHDSENQIVGISQNVKDITLQKQSDLKIHQQNEKLKTIAWQQCHEVRGPLANILGLCNLVTNQPELNQETTHQYVKYIQKSCQDLDQIIQDIIKKTTNE